VTKKNKTSEDEALRAGTWKPDGNAPRNTDRPRLLLDISDIILSATTLEEVIGKIFDMLHTMLDFHLAGVYWIDDARTALRPGILYHAEQVSAELYEFRIPLGKGIIGYVAQTGKGELVNNAHLDPRAIYPNNITVSCEHLIAIPINAKGVMLGIMYIGRTVDPGFTWDEFEVVELFIGHVAVAIEHARLFEEIKVSEEKYRALFEDSQDAIFVSSPGGRFLDMNPAGVRMFGYETREELLAADLRVDIYVSHEERDRYMKEIMEKGAVKDFEISARRRTGEPLLLLETATAVRDKNDKIVAFRGILRDVTQVKLLEQQLLQAQKLESLGTLAGGIAHDFNNILAIIIAYVSRIERGKVTHEDMLKGLETIKQASWRGAELVRQILTFARKTNTLSESVDINALLAENGKMLAATMPRTILFTLDLEKGIPNILADHNQLHQVVMNLCVNARDAMPEGGTITLGTRTMSGADVRRKFPDAQQTHYVCISVQDTGEGMPPEVMLRVFEPFFTTKAQGKGTGLGLAMVYGIVQNHNGHIGVESAPGKGTTFSLYLPMPAESMAYFKSKTDSDSSVEKAEGTILLVEDEQLLREFMQAHLEGRGFRVITAADGLQAVDMFYKHKDEISLVFSDMGLPNLGGWEAFKKMKEYSDSVRAVFATGYLDPDMRSEILKSGVKGIIAKPYIPEEVSKMIVETLTRQQ
jgi:PAS domain S-box-containing protein